jgi:hypothetical protein
VGREFWWRVLAPAPAAGGAGGDDSEVDTLARLVASLVALDPELQRAGLRFVAWRLAVLPREEELRPFYLFAVLRLVLAVRPDLPPAQVAGLADALLAEEAAVRSGGWAFPAPVSSQWLLGLVAGQSDDVWRSLAADLPRLAGGIADEAVRQLVSALGGRVGDTAGSDCWDPTARLSARVR